MAKKKIEENEVIQEELQKEETVVEEETTETANDDIKSAAEKARAERKARVEKTSQSIAEKKEKKANESKKKKLIKKLVPIFAAVLVVVIALLCFFGVPQRTLTAVKLADGSKVSVAEFEYFYKYYYVYVANYAYQYDQYYEGYGYYATGFDYTRTPENQELPLDMFSDEEFIAEMKEDFGDTPTWADYLEYQTIQTCQTFYTTYNLAKEAGLTLSDEEIAEIDEDIESYRESAAEEGYSLSAYLREQYGRGMNEKIYRSIMEMQYMYDKYVTYLSEDFEASVTDDDINAYFTENANEIKECSFRYFELYVEPATNTEDDTSTEDVDESTNYTDEELDAMTAKDKAETEAKMNEFLEKATADNFTDLTAKYCDADYVSYYQDSTYYSSVEDVTYSSVSSYFDEEIANWVYDSSRQIGDKQLFTIEDEDGCISYIVVLMSSLPTADETVPVNVRHILVKVLTEDDGETDDDGNVITRTAEEAKALAQEILDSYLAGELTEDAFAALASEKSDDTASTDDGGLYSVTEDAGYVEPFTTWALSADRKAGDTGIVEVTEEQSGSYAGYHIMYYVGPDKYPLWMQSTITAMEDEILNAYYESLYAEDATLKTGRIEKIINRCEDLAANWISNYVTSDDDTSTDTDTETDTATE